MALEHATVIVDYDTNQQDVSNYTIAAARHLNKANGVAKGDNALQLRIPIRLSGFYNVDKRMMVWDGWRDDVTHHWIQKDLWGGYIRVPASKKVGGMRVYDLSLDSYDVLLTTTVVEAYPDPQTLTRTFHSPPNPTDVGIKGYKPGYTPRDHLVGLITEGKPNDGLIPTYLGAYSVDRNGIGPEFSSIVLDVTSRWSNTIVPGHMEGLYLGDAAQMIVANAVIVYAARFGGLIRPAVYLRAIPDPGDPTWVIPQFCAQNLDAPGSATLTFSDAPGAGEVGEWWDYQLTPDASTQYTRVVVIGKGSVDAGPDPSAGGRFRKRIYYDDSRYALDNPPTRYQTTPGWAFLVRDDSITTQEMATGIGRYIADSLHLGTDTHTFKCEGNVTIERGDIIRIKHQTTQGEGTSGVNVPVTSVTQETQNGRVINTVTAGWPRQSAQDILNGPVMALLGLKSRGITVNRAGSGPTFNNPNTPQVQSLYSTPGNGSVQNVIGMTDSAPVWQMRAAANRGLITADGQPIDPDPDNFLSAPIPNPPQRPLPGTSIIPPPMFPVYDGGGNLVQWYDADGVDHPQHHVYEFAFDDFTAIVFPAPVMLSTVIVKAERDATGKVVGRLIDDGAGGYKYVDAAGSITTPSAQVSIEVYDQPSDTMVTQAPPVDAQHPLYLGYTSYANVRVTALASGRRAEVLVSERGADPSLFTTNS